MVMAADPPSPSSWPPVHLLPRHGRLRALSLVMAALDAAIHAFLDVSTTLYAQIQP